MPLLEAINLRKAYAGRTVVNGVSFRVHPGEIVGLLGRNGAGKTTSFRMTIGMIDADGGTVTFDGQDLTGLPMYLRARRGMGYLSQEYREKYEQSAPVLRERVGSSMPLFGL